MIIIASDDQTFFLFIRLWWRRLFPDRTGHVDVAFLLLTVSKCAKNRQASSPSFPSLSVGFILQDMLHLSHPPHTSLECLGIAAPQKPEVGHSIFGERLACKVSGNVALLILMRLCWLKRCGTVKSGAISGWGPTTSMLPMLSLAAGPHSSQRNYSIPTVSTPFSVRVVDHNLLTIN